MTIGTVGNALSELVKLSEALRASSEAKSLRALEAFLAPHGEAKTGAFLKRATPRRDVGASWTGQRVGSLLAALDAYQDMLRRIASKTGKEFALLVEFLRQYEGEDLSELIKAAEEALTAAPPAKAKSAAVGAATNEQLVAKYVARLKSALGNDSEFKNVFEPLKADKDARTQEVAEIARLMMPSPPSSVDRKKILSAIRDLHLTAKGIDLKLKASRGRSAA